MKKFLYFIGKLILLLLLAAVLLDMGYTFIYLRASERNKVENIINSKERDYDIVFMGSSRMQNHLAAQLFTDKGIKAYNFAISGSCLSETALLLKLMVERHYKIKNLMVDVDLNINSDSYSDGTRALFMPYLHTSKTIQNHFKDLPGYNKLYYIPFYRYIAYDAKVGFREMFFSLIHKKTAWLDHGGFYPLNHIGKNLAYDLSDRSPKRNKAYEEIRAICRKNNINFIPISVPMCQNCDSDRYFKSIKLVYPEVNHYENTVTEDRYFSSCGHMNVEGATLFTQKILNDFTHNKFHH